MAFIAKQRYKLDITPKGGWVVVYASQHDDGAREIEFEIKNQGNVFSIPASINVSVQGIKANHNYFSHSCSYSGNVVTMALADDMTDIIGKAICVLKFTNSSQQKLATAKFILNVDSDSSSEGIIIDTEAEEIFNQMLNEIRAQAASVSADIAELQSMVGSPLVASTASAMTDHNKIYVYTGSESGYTSGNWYYWNGSAWTSGGVYNAVAVNIDSVPVQGSNNAVSSGSVYNIQTALEKIGVEIDITDTIHFTQGGGVQYNYEGKVTNSTTASFSDYVDVSKFDKVKLTMRLNVNSSSYGIAFYKEPNLSDGSFIGGVQENYGAEQESAEVRTIDIPEDANYIRTTWIKNDQPHYSDYTFSCVGITNGRIGELEDNVSNLIDICGSLESIRIPLYPNQFIGNAYKNASGTTSDNDHCIVTERPLIFKNHGNVHVYTTDPNLSFSWKLSTDSTMKTGVKEFRFSGDVELQLNVLTDDNTPVKSSDLNSIIIETNETVYNHYIDDNFFKPTTSNRFDDYGGDNIHRYGMYNTGDQIGFAQRGNAYYRITSMPCICEHDLTIYCGINNSLNLEILVNGVLTTIQYGQWFKVPKNTVFAVAFKSTSRNSSNNISTSGIYIIDDSVPSADITQYVSQAVVTRADCGFMVDDKVFLISSTGLYSVYGSGAFLVTDATLDHTAGHANSCNYYDGKVYVSDWTDNTLIHVYSVDTTNNTLTYVKDLVIPIENVGRIEYFVRNDENEVFFIGWQNGDSSVNPNTLIYGLYVLTTEGYEQSWIRKAFRPKVLQSFTMQGNYIYMVECDTNYKTTGIIILNLETGLTIFSEAVGTITTFESETIIPIGLQSFLLADSRGRLFLKTVVL